MKDEIILVNSIDEITKTDTKYAHVSNPNKWIKIDKDAENEYSVYGMVCGDQPTAITGSNVYLVKNWKTFNGVKNSLKRYSKDGGWGMNHWK
jgi:hypothetical protein